jgi:hypothetical protein
LVDFHYNPSSLGGGGFSLSVMKISRRALWLIVLVIPLLWLLWPKGGHEGNEAQGIPLRKGATSHELMDQASQAGGTSGRNDKTSSRRGQGKSNLSSTSPSSAEVDAILLDENITDDQAAQKLRGIAADASFPLPQREEAMHHGLNLQPSAFGDFAEAQPDLPVELALPLLQSMINFNESPKDQIRTYLALKDHADPEIAEQALEMLAFMVEDDAREKTPEQWEQMAQEKLRKMEEEKEE